MPITFALAGTKTTLPFGKRTPPAYPVEVTTGPVEIEGVFAHQGDTPGTGVIVFTTF